MFTAAHLACTDDNDYHDAVLDTLDHIVGWGTDPIGGEHIPPGSDVASVAGLAFWVAIGEALRGAGRWEEAITAFGRALEIEESPELFNNRGSVLPKGRGEKGGGDEEVGGFYL